ncbi:hypothetical protein PORY_002372 [Pneumocystis oryctolagi]|uniref:Uncharacterized protein n=1 Tax=Pneumocystis oryctolagi TaxID=42067 RepID=A0ACB7C9F6_9ASCO|nr:hypothetical protein PORY_002372 [Pneumocystis oryctolagi]
MYIFILKKSKLFKLYRTFEIYNLYLFRGFSCTIFCTSGHNKWSKIKHKKKLVDSTKSQCFSKITSDITLAVKTGGCDPNTNPRLASAIVEAKKENMTKTLINNAIQRGIKDSVKNIGRSCITYEAKVGNVSLIMNAFYNKFRTVAKIRELLKKWGGRMVKTSYLFSKVGKITIPKHKCSFDKILHLKIDNDIKEINENSDSYQIIVSSSIVATVAKKIQYEISCEINTDILWVPNPDTSVYLSNKSDENDCIFGLIRDLKNEPDIYKISSNCLNLCNLISL